MSIWKINASLWLFCMKMTIILKIKAEGKQMSEPEKTHSIGEFVIVTKFGDHVLHHLASSLLNVIRQAGRRKFQFRWLFKTIQCLAFGNYLVVLNAISGFGSAKTTPWTCFSLLKIFVGCFLWVAVLGACTTLGVIPTKQ